jgi:hypothetical protein
VTKPSASQARKAEEEIPTRAATSLIRREAAGLRETDDLDKFFVLDITPGIP